MNKKVIKGVGSILGAATLVSGAVATQTQATTVPAAAEERVAPESGVAKANGITVSAREEREYESIANVRGEFAFDQNVITPPDEVFNLFGTAATAMCAKPGFAFDNAKVEELYLNFSGAIKKTQTVSLAALQDQGTEERTLKCSCATGAAIANAQVVGVPLKNIMQIVDAEEAANTVTFRSGDGYGIAMPLTYALEKDTIFVYKIGESDVPSGLQVWVPKSVARYGPKKSNDISHEISLIPEDTNESEANAR